MRGAGFVVMALMLGTISDASAHRLDEYLQATMISVKRDRIQAEIRLTPGVAVFPLVLAAIDTNGDGVISEPEKRVYAAKVLHDVSLSLDGIRLHPQLVSKSFPDLDDMKQGRGEIELTFTAAIPNGGRNRRLVFENRHEAEFAAYLVNCLVPADPNIHVVTQNRSYSQSFYQLDYEQAGPKPTLAFAGLSDPRAWLAIAALILIARFVLRLRLMKTSRAGC